MRFGTGRGGQLPVWRPIQPVNCKILIEIQEHPIKTRIPVAQQQFPFIINSTARVRVNVLFYILPAHTFPFCGSHQHQQCIRVHQKFLSDPLPRIYRCVSHSVGCTSLSFSRVVHSDIRYFGDTYTRFIYGKPKLPKLYANEDGVWVTYPLFERNCLSGWCPAIYSHVV